MAMRLNQSHLRSAARRAGHPATLRQQQQLCIRVKSSQIGLQRGTFSQPRTSLLTAASVPALVGTIGLPRIPHIVVLQLVARLFAAHAPIIGKQPATVTGSPTHNRVKLMIEKLRVAPTHTIRI